MAKAEKRYSIDGKGGVTLTLSHDEADTLSAIFCRVNGSGDSPRKHMEAMRTALENVGYFFQFAESYKLLRRGRMSFSDPFGDGGSIHFEDYPKPWVPDYYRCKASAGGKVVKWLESKPTDAHNWERVTVTTAK